MADENTNPQNNPENNPQNNPENNPQNNPENNPQNNPPKTFTQEDVTRMLANEKRQGRQSLLRELGLDINDKDAVKKAKTILNEQRSEAERNATALKNAEALSTEAEKRAEAAERKLTVLLAGCQSDYVDEVTALAAIKVNDTTTFEQAVEQVKEKCANFFGGTDTVNNPGTGSGQGHRKQTNPDNEKGGSLGARLAQKTVSANTAKNPYFSN